MNKIKTIFSDLNPTTRLKIIGVFVFFTLIVLPTMSFWMYQVTGTTGSPDTTIDLSLNTYYSIRHQYEMIGRRLYIVQRYTFDLVWPFVYTIFLLTLLGTLNRKFKINNKFYFLPIIAIGLDFVENILSTFFMVLYPKTMDTLLYFLMGTTIIKWIFIVLVTTVLIIELIQIIYIKIKKK